MDTSYIFMIGAYWIFLAGTVFLAGSLTAKLVITGPSGADSCIHPNHQKTFGSTALPLILTVSIITFTTNLVHMVLHCSVMTDTPLTEVWNILPVFLMKTRYGQYSLVRTVLTGILVLTHIVMLKKQGPVIWWAGYVFTFILLLSLALSGHQGSKGFLNLPFVLDILHIIAISLWIGGLFFIYTNYACFCRKAGQKQWDIFLRLVHRISVLATVCVTVVVLTGAALYFFSIKSLSSLFSTDFGIVLAVKTGLAMILMLIGGANKFIFIPGLDNTERNEWSRLCSFRGRLFTAMTIEVYLGLAVLLATSLLTHLSPTG